MYRNTTMMMKTQNRNEVRIRLWIIGCLMMVMTMSYAQDDADCGCGQPLLVLLIGQEPFHALLITKPKGLTLFTTKEEYRIWQNNDYLYKRFDKERYLTQETSACQQLQHLWRKLSVESQEKKALRFGTRLNHLVSRAKINYHQMGTCLPITYRVE
ncbi:MAG: hypothetical protein OXC67_07585 [Flavobacteriaceae bacterium]|nr:hypothetical protein [Flavobacteriaceae bacterium]